MTKDLSNVKGSCLCGAVTFELSGTADAFHLCHCTRCRRSTGSSNASNIFTAGQNLRWLSGTDSTRRFDLPEAEFYAKQFCTHCGSAVPCCDPGGKLAVIPAGSLQTELSFTPDDSIFWESRANWYDSGCNATKFNGNPE
ncbi:MAG: GFA family protein [Pseudomonadales bacterium]